MTLASVIGAIALGVIATTLVALAGRSAGRRARGNLQLAAILLGLGEPADPPTKHLVAARGREDDGEARAAPGEPLRPRS